MARNVLVTGVSRYLGARFARAICAAPGVERVIGVDVVPPRADIGDTEYARVDIRHPLISRVIRDAQVDTVVHASVISTPTAAGGRASMKEINVLGSMQLLAACQANPSVTRLVVKSTAGVYGASPRDPSMYTEDADPKSPPRTGWGKDTAEVEGYVRAFSRRRPEVDVTVLRFANIVGPGMRTMLTDYLELAVPIVVAGFDPRLQLVHEDDAVAAILAALAQPVTGTVNIAGDGMLTLLQMMAMAGRVPAMVPGPLMSLAARAVKRTSGVELTPDDLLFLRHGRGLDTTRMRRELGLGLRFSTRAAFEDHVRARGLEGYHARRLPR